MQNIPPTTAFARAARLLLCITLFYSVCGCASVFRSQRPNDLMVISEPDSAVVVVDGYVYGITPDRIELPPAPRYVVEYHRPGYRPLYDTVEASISTSWLVADILCSLPTFGIPLAADALSGMWYDIDKEAAEHRVLLIPDSSVTSIPLPPLAASAPDMRPALLLETGVSYPQYQVPVVPTSYSLGFLYTPAEWLVLAVRQDMHSTGTTVTVPGSQGNPSRTDASVLTFATTVDGRLPLFSSGFSIVGGAGILHANVERDTDLTSGWLPVVSAGAGYSFPGSLLSVEVRRSIALGSLSMRSPNSDFTPRYTTIRIGLRLPFGKR